PGRRVLVTGATGYIASQILPALRERHELVLCDVRPGPEVRIANLADPDVGESRALFEGVDTVVHLAYNRHRGDPATDYLDERTNVDMAHNVYRLTQEAGGRRVVMASSNHAADFWEHAVWRRELDMVYPDRPRP